MAELLNLNLIIGVVAKNNNISMLSKEIQEKYVSEKGNLLTNEHLQLSNAQDTIKNFYCIGDIVEIPVIKTASWAAEIIFATNIFSLLPIRLYLENCLSPRIWCLYL